MILIAQDQRQQRQRVHAADRYHDIFGGDAVLGGDRGPQAGIARNRPVTQFDILIAQHLVQGQIGSEAFR